MMMAVLHIRVHLKTIWWTIVTLRTPAFEHPTVLYCTRTLTPLKPDAPSLNNIIQSFNNKCLLTDSYAHDTFTCQDDHIITN